MVDVTRNDVEVTLKKGTDKVLAFADVTINGFGSIMGCPVMRKEGKLHCWFPQRAMKDKNYDILRLQVPVESLIKDAVFAAVETAGL